jgi:AcrR family transcriptional regulator
MEGACRALTLPAEDVAYRRHLDARLRFSGSRLQKTDMDDIAHAVGLARNSLYRYYKNKDFILLACVERDMGAFVERMRTLDSLYPDPVQRIGAWLDMQMDMATSPAHATMELMAEIRTDAPELRKRLVELHDAPGNVLQGTVAEITRGKRRDSGLIIALIKGMVEAAAGQAIAGNKMAASASCAGPSNESDEELLVNPHRCPDPSRSLLMARVGMPHGRTRPPARRAVRHGPRGKRLESYNQRHEMTPEMRAALRKKIALYRGMTDRELDMNMNAMGPDYEWYVSDPKVKGTTGILVLSHGVGENSDRLVREAYGPMAKKTPLAIGFGMAMMNSSHLQSRWIFAPRRSPDHSRGQGTTTKYNSLTGTGSIFGMSGQLCRRSMPWRRVCLGGSFQRPPMI